LYCPRRKTELT